MFSILVSNSRFMDTTGEAKLASPSTKGPHTEFVAFVHFPNRPVVKSRKGIFSKNCFQVFISDLNVQETE